VKQPAIRELADKFKALLDEVPSANSALSKDAARRLRSELGPFVADLQERLAEIDPVRRPVAVFDPANPQLFGTFAAIALVGQDRIPLSAFKDSRLYGSGVYAIYYTGDFELYRPISESEHPIYVGKADPATPNAKAPEFQGQKLSGRLREHLKNIKAASSSLVVDDFECRLLVVASGWQGAAETALIEMFRPIWNQETGVAYGFGKHGDAATTRSNKRSPWDVLHPGRRWAEDTSLEDATTSPQRLYTKKGTKLTRHKRHKKRVRRRKAKV
jgi:hypothetical protein